MNPFITIALLLSLGTNIYQLIKLQSFASKHNSLIDDFCTPIIAPVQKQIYDLFKKALKDKTAQEKVRYMNHDFTIIVNKETSQ